MRKILAGMHLLAAVLFLASPAIAEVAALKVSTLVIRGMTPGSGDKVRRELETLPGVVQVKVSEEAGLAVVVYDPARAKAEEFTRAMQSASDLATFAKAGKGIVNGSALGEAVS